MCLWEIGLLCLWEIELLCLWEIGLLCLWEIGLLCLWEIGLLCLWEIGLLCLWEIGLLCTLGVGLKRHSGGICASTLVLRRIVFFGNVFLIEAMIWSKTSLQVNPPNKAKGSSQRDKIHRNNQVRQRRQV